MHAVGLHSALAIKRQRKRRDEQRRARERRYSSQSCESGLTSPRTSSASLDQHHHRHHKKKTAHSSASQGMLDSKVVTSIGMLHIGVVSLVLGAFLLASGVLPDDFVSWRSNTPGRWWNELVAIGLFAIAVGVFLIVLNRVITKKEENELEKYVERQLTRSKSGHRLERDLETGCLTTKHAKRARQCKSTTELTTSIVSEIETETKSPPKSPPPAYSAFAADIESSTTTSPQLLDNIVEEEAIVAAADKLLSPKIGIVNNHRCVVAPSNNETQFTFNNILNSHNNQQQQQHLREAT